MHTERGHHVFSPSTLNARLQSPCWRPAGGSTEAAVRGTLQHQAVEAREDCPDLDDHEATAVAEAIRLVENRKAELESVGYIVDTLSEQYLPIDTEVMVDAEGRKWEGTTGGYADAVLVYCTIDGWCVEVIDFKFGRLAVTDARHNFQGFAYVLGAAEWVRRNRDPKAKMHSATVTFFSPHREGIGETINTCTFNSEEISAMGDYVRSVVRSAEAALCAIDTALAKDGLDGLNKVLHYFRPTHATCIFCGFLGKCPAVKNLMLDLVKKYAPAEVPADIRGWDSSDPEQLAIGIKVADLAKRWADSWRSAHTARCLDNPNLVPQGYRLVSTTPTKVVDRPGLNKYLVDRFGENTVAEHVDVALTPFIKLVRSEAPRGEKDHAEEEFRAELEAKNFTKPSDVPTLSLRMV